MKVEKVRRAITRLRDKFIDFCINEELPFDTSDLAGACGICSYLVFVTLKNMGLSPVFHMNDNHCFVTCDGQWIDLTLTQFNCDADPVYLYPFPYRLDRAGHGFVHLSEKQANTERKIRQLFAEWPEDQNPFKQRIPKLPKTSRLTTGNKVV